MPTSAISDRWWTWRSSNRAAFTSAWIRWAARASPTGIAIAERYGLNLEVVNHAVDATFRFMTRGLGRPDPHGSVLALRDGADGRAQGSLRRRVCVRHGCRPARHRDAAATGSSSRITISRPRSHTSSPTGRTGRPRRRWARRSSRSSMIDRVAARLGRRLIEVPVGFKWFVDGLIDGSIGFCGEESAGATFLRRDGAVWTTDKDGLVPDLLAAEMTARTGKDPGELFQALTAEFGTPYYDAGRRGGHARAEGAAQEALARGGPGVHAGRRADHREADPRARQRRADRRAQGRGGQRLVRGAAVRAPRTSTRSTRRVSGTARTWTRSSRRRKES